MQTKETEQNRQYWLQQGIGKSHLALLAEADALIVPEKEFREGVNFVFHQDTSALYKYLKKELEGKAIIELCADDEEYKEIALHSAIHRISQIIVTYAAAPLIVGLLTNYIYDELKAKPNDTIEASIVVEDEKCKAFIFKFKGETKDFHQISDEVGEFSRICTTKVKR